MRLRILLLMLIGLLLAACGTVAEPRPSFNPTATALPRAPHTDVDGEQTELVPLTELDGLEPLTVEPTAVPLTEPQTEEPEATEPSEEVSPEAELEETEPEEAEAEEATSEAVAVAEAESEGLEEEATSEAELEETEEAETEETPTTIEVNGVAYEGDAFSGEIWFSQIAQVTYQNVTWNCATCHNVEERLPGSGPYLYGLATVAGERVEDEDAITYLVNAILHPNDFISPAQTNPDGDLIEWQPDVMPNNWDTVLDDQTVADLVAYLLTLDQPLE